MSDIYIKELHNILGNDIPEDKIKEELNIIYTIYKKGSSFVLEELSNFVLIDKEQYNISHSCIKPKKGDIKTIQMNDFTKIVKKNAYETILKYIASICILDDLQYLKKLNGILQC